MDHFQHVAIVMATLNKKNDALRQKLGLATIQKAVSQGYEVIICDRGSDERFAKEAEKLGATVIHSDCSSMGGQRREGILKALESDAQVIVLMEPEKINLIDHIAELVEPILNNTTDIVIPRRKNLDSYPSLQQQTEPVINAYWKKVTDTDFDVIFGPRVFSREAAQYVLKYKGEHGDVWENLFTSIIDAMKDNKRIVSREISYIHPTEQTAFEENSPEFDHKRLMQVHYLTTFFYNYWNNRKFA